MSADDQLSATLYSLLSRPAPVGADTGETAITRQKETLDNDVEAFEIEHPLMGPR
jgi:hypothetical protein